MVCPIFLLAYRSWRGHRLFTFYNPLHALSRSLSRSRQITVRSLKKIILKIPREVHCERRFRSFVMQRQTQLKTGEDTKNILLICF